MNDQLIGDIGYNGKTFSQVSNLKKHTRTIQNCHKDHNCDICGKSFATLHVLETHLHTVHEGHKDHKCESCGISFSQRGHLKKHKTNCM